ncbi:MAG: V-type ATP synthase subunit I [Clostridiales bacterium]|jgi:V/A-type H+-transporting ATPase subunit I|nr:V-type ATP synthase subunit I [Clostridiales bacterium]
MSVVKLDEFTLLTLDSYKEPLLKRLQEFEGVHFKNLQTGDLDGLKPDRALTDVSELEAEIAKIRFAINKIEPFVKKAAGFKAYMTAPPEMSFKELDDYAKNYDYESVCAALKRIDEEMKGVSAEINAISAENESLRIWRALDVSPEETDALQYVSCFYGVLGKAGAAPFIEAINEKFEASFYDVISAGPNETSVIFGVLKEQADDALRELKNAGFSKVTLDAPPVKRIEENEARLKALREESENLQGSVAAMAAEYHKLLMTLDSLATILERGKARENFLTTVNAVVIDGWAPSDSFGELEEATRKCCGDEYYMERREAEAETAPVKLKNSKMASAFEGITRMYALPKYGEIDPTPHLAPFYIAFFGIMVGDMGFGLLLLALSIFVKRAPGFSNGVKEFMNMMFYCAIAVTVAGALFGGFFGVTVFSPLRMDDGGFKPILDSRLDIQNMLVYSLAIGLAHIIYGLWLKGWSNLKDGKPLDALFDSGFWIICILSATVWLVGAVGVLPSGAAVAGKWAFIASAVGLALTQGRENATIVGKAAGGLFGVYGITGYLGDIVSYTRLVALMLSGAYIGMSFNMMAGLVAGEFSLGIGSIIRLLFAAVIAVLGQALNVGLSALGAYVHTCRLQYVEFFGKFYDGGGKPFTPFGAVSATVKIKK